MNRAKKSFAAPTAKPCDVEYRLRRLQERLTDSLMFLRSIDPSVYPDDYAAVTKALESAATAAFAWKSPAKKARRTTEEKAAAAAERQLAKEQTAATKKKKAAPVAKAEKTPAKKTEKVETPAAKPANTAIERALAAAKARKAAKEAA